ncbi:uncharacterized protein At3g27210-like [Malania oleifera]|uniref:uncharacterized protein At3g27210-like n=1 Tax=Malania oleifera TaxID=397392 RepID=UPI0025AEB178|nr:uncharacterized protein At3g27210-like [Malania oleifera]
MGSCASVHKVKESTVEPKLPVGSDTGYVSLQSSESPTKEIGVNAEAHPVVETTVIKPQKEAIPNFPHQNSKEEMFFDSQFCLESDCEDFFSVNGDVSPSRGTSPVRQSSSSETSRLVKSLYVDIVPNSDSEQSLMEKKKKLVELFRDSFNRNPVHSDKKSQNKGKIIASGRPEPMETIFDLHPMSIDESPRTSAATSICSTERTLIQGIKPKKERVSQSSYSCFSNAVRGLKPRERKKRLSLAESGEG